ncbi:MAG: NAD(P)-binding domain-containing protein [Nitrospinota bacterium]
MGTGIMGRPMATNLLRAGYPVAVHNRSRPPLEELARAGATVCGSAAEAASKAEVILTCLPDSPDAWAVAPGSGGIIEGASKGSLYLDMSTISPAVSKKVAALAEGQDESSPRAIGEAIAQREEQKRDLGRELQRLSPLGSWPRLYRAELEAEVRRDLADFAELLRGDPERARRALTAVLDGPIVFGPAEEDGRRFYRFEGKLRPGEVLAGAPYKCGVPRGTPAAGPHRV